jgi:hypothetical protein
VVEGETDVAVPVVEEAVAVGLVAGLGRAAIVV